MAEEMPNDVGVQPVADAQPEGVVESAATENVAVADESVGTDPESVAAPDSAAPDDSEADAVPAAESDLADVPPEELEEARANEVAFSWQASEYVHHHKGPGWYLMLFGGLAVLVAVSVFLHLWLEIGLFVAMGVAVWVYASKPPRTLTYDLTPKGVVIEGRARDYTEFRSFGVVKEEDWHTIDLEPLKRFGPRLSILFDPQDFENIVGHLELHLPRADREPDPIEKASRYLRF